MAFDASETDSVNIDYVTVTVLFLANQCSLNFFWRGEKAS